MWRIVLLHSLLRMCVHILTRPLYVCCRYQLLYISLSILCAQALVSSVEGRELWPCLLSKAVYKLYHLTGARALQPDLLASNGRAHRTMTMPHEFIDFMMMKNHGLEMEWALSPFCMPKGQPLEALSQISTSTSVSTLCDDSWASVYRHRLKVLVFGCGRRAKWVRVLRRARADRGGAHLPAHLQAIRSDTASHLFLELYVLPSPYGEYKGEVEGDMGCTPA